MTTLDAIDVLLLQRLHGDFPLEERPFAAVAADLGLEEAEVIGRLQRLLEEGVLTRFGPLFQIERAGGSFLLAAMAVPPERFEAVATQVNAQPEVAHNYERDHRLNMWFVIAAETAAQAGEVCARIEALTGLEVLAFPKQREYFVELRLPVAEGDERGRAARDCGAHAAGGVAQ